MNKVLLLNKPQGITSRDAVNQLTKIFNTKKIGHTGTLDPLATGVLVICINEATKLCEILTSKTKEYIATLKLGILTDTLDITGQIVKKEKAKKYKEEQIIKVLNSFLGKSIQEVPIYSAVKVNGKKLYEYARNNEPVKLPKREIEILEIELLKYEDDTITFRTIVSKGTYIRSLINDIAKSLNTIGTMSSLVRTKQGKFNIEDSYTLEEIKNNKFNFLDIIDCLTEYRQYHLNDEEYFKIKNGAIIPNKGIDDKIVFVYKNKVVAIYQMYEKDTSKLKPYKIFTS